MISKVEKRNGKIVDFEKERIEKAILGAMSDANHYKPDTAKRIANEISKTDIELMSVYDIERMVENKLMASSLKDVARCYIEYRSRREIARAVDNAMYKRNKNVLELLEGHNKYLKYENSNKNADLLSTQRDYMAGEVSKEICSEFIYDKDLIEAHKEGIIHIHDMDFAAMRMHNCCVWNLEDMLQNGTVLSKVGISKPKSFGVACTVATQIVMQIAASQFGGQTFSIAHLAPFARITYNKRLNHYLNEKKFNEEMAKELAYDDMLQDIKDGVQTIQHQLITYSGTQGQSPFVTIFIYLGETTEYKKELALIAKEIFKQRIKGIPNKQGHFITVAFPKIIYVLEEDNITEDSPYWWLTVLAAECSAKRLVPDYISEKMMFKYKEGNCYPCMGCRSFLQPYKDKNGNYKFYGRFNQGVVSINLVDVALSSKQDFDSFWRIFDERLDLCYRALMRRHKRLLGTLSDVAPILWQDGALARLQSGETIDKLLYDDYSSISLGYAGIFECVKYMTGESHTQQKGYDFAVQIMQHLNDVCVKWKKDTNIGFSVYGTPIESTTYKFAKCLRKRFGTIPEITDKDYITNSYHINVKEDVDAFTKLEFEGKLQKYSLGGAISYIETPNMQNNIPALLEVIKFIYDNTMYAEINTKSDYCQECGYDGEMFIDDDMNFYCPNCGNKDFSKMNVARRVCGYISTEPFNRGRTQEIKERVLHLGNE